MSTRSCIARAEGDGWSGRYVHSDGYPTWRGAELWKLWHTVFDGDIEAMLHCLIDEHPAGWSHLSGDWKKPAGFVERMNKPANLSWRDWFDSFGPACFCHGDRHEPEQTISHEYPDPLFIEWVYIFSPTHLTILAHKHCRQTDAGAVAYGEDWAGVFYYRHVHVVTLPLAGDEPDWQDIQDKGYALYEALDMEVA